MPPTTPLTELVDRYLSAAEPEKQQRLIKDILDGKEHSLGAWSEEIVSRLLARFQNLLDNEEDGSKPNVEAGDLGHVLSRWNALGVSAAINGRLPEAENLFRELLSILRRNQPRLGRLHKGTPLHELGWLRLRSDPEAATPYVLAALIEDVIRDPNGFTDGAAAQVCLNVLGIDPSLFEDVKEFVNAEISGPKEVQDLARSDPELLSLVRSMNELPHTKLLRISLHYDPALGELLHEAAIG